VDIGIAKILKNKPLEVVVMANSNPVTPQELQEVEHNIEIATQALASATANAKELGRLMDERTPKVIKKMYDLYDGDAVQAQKSILELGYTKEDIRACGYDVV